MSRYCRPVVSGSMLSKKGLRYGLNDDFLLIERGREDSAMMGRQYREQASLFYEFRLDDMIPKGHLLRRINVFVTSVCE